MTDTEFIKLKYKVYTVSSICDVTVAWRWLNVKTQHLATSVRRN